MSRGPCYSCPGACDRNTTGLPRSLRCGGCGGTVLAYRWPSVPALRCHCLDGRARESTLLRAPCTGCVGAAPLALAASVAVLVYRRPSAHRLGRCASPSATQILPALHPPPPDVARPGSAPHRAGHRPLLPAHPAGPVCAWPRPVWVAWPDTTPTRVTGAPLLPSFSCRCQHSSSRLARAGYPAIACGILVLLIV